MRDMQDKELYELINRRLKDHEVSYEEGHWTKMAEKIKSESSGNTGYRHILWYLGILFFTAAVVFSIYRLITTPVPTQSPPSVLPNSPTAVNPADNAENLADKSQTDSKTQFKAAANLVEDSVVSGVKKSKTADNQIFLKADKYAVDKMIFQQSEGEMFLPMQYGSEQGTNPRLKELQATSITKIQLYYTDHPKGMNLDYLNKKRLEHIFGILPGLANNREIKWEVIAQRGALGKEEARRYFHGFKIFYNNKGQSTRKARMSILRARPPAELILSTPAYQTFLVEHKIRQDILSKKIHEDSTTYKVFERNWSNWKNAVVVCDWTTSMFKYGTQVVSWLSEHEDAKNISGFVFFNDCDAEGRALGRSARSGEMFAVKSTRTNEVLDAMIAAVRKGGANQDLEENDAQAIKYAYDNFPEAEEIVLIADNVSPVRHMSLINDVKKPVKIIICGTTLIPDLAIQPDYFTIAKKTSGSIHTIEDDLESLKNIKKGTWIKVGDIYYKYKSMEFRPTGKKRRPRVASRKSGKQQ